MSKIIERIVKSIGSPSENDLWLKEDGQDLSLNAYDNGEWKLVVGGGGGGGDATDAIKYTEQTLTEEQQMQARKNQGLYYKEGETVSSLIWDGVPSEDDIHIYEESLGLDYYLHKVSSVAIPPSQMLGATVSWVYQGVEQSSTITQGTVNAFESEAAQGYYNDPSVGFTVVLDDSIEDPSIGATVPRGVWFASVSAGGLSMFAKSIVLAEPYTEETIHYIDPKYIKDMYYSEETPAGVITWDGNTEGKESIDLGGMLAYKVANSPKDIPQDAWLGFTSTEQLETTPFAQIVDFGQMMPGVEGNLLVGETGDGFGVLVADQFSMYAEDTTIEADGIYFTLNVRSFSYDAYCEIIHQVPAKYIPITKTLDSESSDDQIPSAKAVYDIIGNVETLLAAL